jgi:hypothetical protein
LVVERRAKPGILVSIQANVRAHLIAITDFGPPGAERGAFQRHAASHDGHQPTARRESQERLFNVPGAKRSPVTVNSSAGR